MADEHIELIESEIEPTTAWDKRVVGALNVAQGARRGVLILRLVAAIAAVGSIVGSAMYIFSDDYYGNMSSDASFSRQSIGQFLSSVSTPLAFAAIVYALSFLVQISAARLDVDIVIADENEPSFDQDA